MIYRSVKKTDGVRVPILGQVENFMENYQGHSLASASPNAGVQRFEKKIPLKQKRKSKFSIHRLQVIFECVSECEKVPLPLNGILLLFLPL